MRSPGTAGSETVATTGATTDVARGRVVPKGAATATGAGSGGGGESGETTGVGSASGGVGSLKGGSGGSNGLWGNGKADDAGRLTKGARTGPARTNGRRAGRARWWVR